jgi:hypothetical protein
MFFDFLDGIPEFASPTSARAFPSLWHGIGNLNSKFSLRADVFNYRFHFYLFDQELIRALIDAN